MSDELFSDFATVVKRRDDLLRWLRANSPQCFSEQLHCEEGTQERVYWHYGYLMALQDVLKLLSAVALAN